MSSEAGRASGVRTYAAFIVTHRWIVVLLTLLAVGAAGYGTTFLSINPNSRVFFGPKDPHRLALEHLEDTYGKLNSAIIVLAPKDGQVFTQRTLTAVHDLTKKAWETPFSSRVNSLTNYQYSYADGDDVIVEDLVPDPESLDEVALERIKKRALSEDHLVGWLVTKTADVTAVIILVTQPGKDLDEVPEIVTSVRAMLDQARQDYPDIDFYLSGGVVADMAFEEAGDRDLGSVVPLMIILVVVALAVGLRTIFGTAGCVVVIVFSVATALGLAGWSGHVLNAATTGTPIMIMTLGVADCVHLVVSTRHNLRDGLSRREAVIEALCTNFIPICITSLTTAVGYLTLNLSKSPPLQEMGNIVAVGMVAAFIYSVSFFPAFLVMVPMRAPMATNPSGRMIGTAVAWVTSHRVWCFGVTAIVLATMAVGMGRMTFDDDFIRYFDESYAFRRDTDFLQNRLTGLHVLEYSLPSGEDQGISKPAYLKKVEEFAKWFSEQPKVTNVNVLTDTMKRLNMAMHGDDRTYDRIADDRELNAQYLLFYEMSLPFGLDLSTDVDIGHSSLRLTAFLSNVSSNEVRTLGLRGEAWLRDHAPELEAPATGLSMVYAYISERNIRSMMLGTLIALVLISGIMLVVLRSVFVGLISLVPNVIPAAMAFGIWGFLEGEVNLSVSVVGAMTLGIIVDDTVHILTRYLRARRQLGLAPAEAVRYTVERVGIAVILTSVALILGFSMLATSGFAISGQMGLLSAITIFVALLADLTLLPALLVALDKRRN